MNSIPGRRLIMVLFLIFLLLPIYWLVNMSFKTNTEIVTTMTLWPHQPTLENYKRIFTDESWYSGYINSLTYVLINTVISIAVALPAAYAFSRYRFLGDKHLFFWLLSNRMAPAAVFALPVVPEVVSPMLAVVPMQLFASRLASIEGTNPDKFRMDDPAYEAAFRATGF